MVSDARAAGRKHKLLDAVEKKAAEARTREQVLDAWNELMGLLDKESFWSKYSDGRRFAEIRNYLRGKLSMLNKQP